MNQLIDRREVETVVRNATLIGLPDPRDVDGLPDLKVARNTEQYPLPG